MEYIIVTLLAIIALIEGVRLYLTHRPTTEWSYFKKRVEDAQKLIWDMQFKAFKTMEIREEIRHEYDMMKSRVASLEGQLANFPVDGNKDELARLEDTKKKSEEDCKRFELQMKQLDDEVKGAKPSNENPEGITGIYQQIDSLKEVKGMVEDYMKK